jgi:hypothetical protein
LPRWRKLQDQQIGRSTERKPFLSAAGLHWGPDFCYARI